MLCEGKRVKEGNTTDGMDERGREKKAGK